MGVSARSLLVCLIATFVTTTGVYGQAPVPEFYGAYSLQGGQLKELNDDPDENDFEPQVRFVLFAKGMSLAQLSVTLFFLPPAEEEQPVDSRFRGWDEFLAQSQKFTIAAQKRLMYDIPSNAVEVPFQIGPYGSHEDMVQIVPRRELPAGFYQLAKGVRFWVRRGDVSAYYASASTSGRGAVDRSADAPARPTEGRYLNSPPARPAGQNPTVATATKSAFYVQNNTFGRIQVFLDRAESPVDVKVGSFKWPQSLEVGSTHHLRVLIGGQAFQRRQVFETEFKMKAPYTTAEVSSRGVSVR